MTSENRTGFIKIKQTGVSEKVTLEEFPEVQRLARELDYGIEVIGLPGSEYQIVNDRYGNIRVLMVNRRLGEGELTVMINLPPNAPFERDLRPFKEALENLRTEAAKKSVPEERTIKDRVISTTVEAIDLLAALGKKITPNTPKHFK